VDKYKVEELVKQFNENNKTMKELAKENGISDKTLSRHFSLLGYYYSKKTRKFELQNGEVVVVEKPPEPKDEIKVKKKKKKISVVVDIDVYVKLHMMKIHDSIEIGEFVENAIIEKINREKP
jgi:hypothetical protein